MRKRVLSIIIAICLTMCLMPITAFAETLLENPVGVTVPTLDEDDTIDVNYGTVTNANGNVNHNYGTIENNGGIISYNFGTVSNNKGEVLINHPEATIKTNKNSVDNSQGTITTNDGYVDLNQGVLNANNNSVFENKGTITTNNAEIITNRGAVTTNEGTIRDSFGTISVNNGTIENNLCGVITTNNGKVINDYKYRIDTSETVNVDFYSGDEEDSSLVCNLGSEVYIKAGAAVIIKTNQGYKFTKNGAPKIIGSSGELTDNGDGTYTLTGVTNDIKITASTEFVPVKDIKLLTPTVYAGQTFELYDAVEVKPKNANNYISWEIVDAGTTGAKVEAPETPGVITVYSEGTLKVKATIENGLAEDRHFTKTLTITVTDPVPEVYDAFKKVQTALSSKDIAMLKDAKNSFEPLLDIYNDFSELQLEMLGEKLGEELTANDVYQKVLDDWINVNIIVQIHNNLEEYKAAQNKTTAKAFVEYYDAIFESNGYIDTQALVLEFIPDIDDIYDKALAIINGNANSQTGGLAEKEPEKQPDKKPASKPNTQTTSPKTNDASRVGLAILFMITALSGVLTLKAARKAFINK